MEKSWRTLNIPIDNLDPKLGLNNLGAIELPKPKHMSVAMREYVSAVNVFIEVIHNDVRIRNPGATVELLRSIMDKGRNVFTSKSDPLAGTSEFLKRHRDAVGEFDRQFQENMLTDSTLIPLMDGTENAIRQCLWEIRGATVALWAPLAIWDRRIEKATRKKVANPTEADFVTESMTIHEPLLMHLMQIRIGNIATSCYTAQAAVDAVQAAIRAAPPSVWDSVVDIFGGTRSPVDDNTAR